MVPGSIPSDACGEGEARRLREVARDDGGVIAGYSHGQPRD
jgi:hypothetical protein